MKMSKEEAIFHGIIREYFPDLAKIVDSGVMDVHDLNIERLFEKCIAKESGIGWVNEQGESQAKFDFLDFSDAKTSSVGRKWDKSKQDYVIKGTITNTGDKQGDLRVVVYNSFTEELHYFLVPHEDIAENSSKGGPLWHINLYYSTIKKDYGIREKYRVATFKDICVVK